MKDITISGRRFVPYITSEELDKATLRIARDIKKDLGDQNPLFVCIMNGAFMFAAELLRAIDANFEVEFARYSSYSGIASTFELKEIMPLKVPVEGRTLIIVEDLIDTGFTMYNLKQKYLAEGAKDVFIVSMLLKKEALIKEVTVDYVGIEIENKFIVGHGLDADGHGRMLKDIYQLAD